MMRKHTQFEQQTASSDTAHAPADSPRHDLDALDRRGQSHPDQASATKPPSTNLLLPRSPLIGRDHEVAAIQRLLLQDEVGLLTLTGPGGIGKTRLALQVAAKLLDHFVDGVYFVSLAPIREAGLVGVTIAQTLGLREAGGQPLLASLQDYIQARQMLLVLDNFEQVVAPASLVGTLLVGCRRLKLLVTSRATLHLYGEQEYAVPPLVLPDAKRLSAIGVDQLPSLGQVAAVALFVQRARAVKPDFALTTTNVTAVAKICISVDGLPLAIELAAAKLKLFSPSALLARLQQRLTLLTGGAKDLPLRQRTLRANIAWSYDLLSPDEQALFRRLAVFAGGFTLEAAQAVCSVDDDSSPESEQALGTAVLDGVASLVDQNLLKQMEQAENEPRFGMLETIREYGLEQLAASGEAEALRRRHAAFFLALAEALEPALLGPDRAATLARLEVEMDNLRAAMAWSQTELGSAEVGLRLAGALAWFAHFANHDGEARNWLLLALNRSSEPTAARAKALWGTGLIGMPQGHAQMASTLLEESVALWRRLGDPRGLASSLREWGFAAFSQGDAAAAQRYCEESVSLWRAIGSQWDLALSLFVLACTVNLRGDQTPALALFEESRALFRDLRDGWGSAITLIGQSFVSGKRGDYTTARARLTEALTSWQDQQDKVSKTDALTLLGEVIQLQGEPQQASGVYVECLLLSRELGDKARCAFMLRHLGSVAHSLRQYSRAVKLIAAAAAVWDTARGALFTTLVKPAELEREIAALRTLVGEETFATFWAEGEAMTLDEAIDFALSAEAPAPALNAHTPVTSSPTATYPAGLTAREVEVLRLLAQDLTYAQIAEQLVISRRTVNGHVTSIYSKLGVASRAAATRYAIDHHLL
jgi:predicted ATPase/DNA-binding CsgD family transcriptional regulator